MLKNVRYACNNVNGHTFGADHVNCLSCFTRSMHSCYEYNVFFFSITLKTLVFNLANSEKRLTSAIFKR